MHSGDRPPLKPWERRSQTNSGVPLIASKPWQGSPSSAIPGNTGLPSALPVKPWERNSGTETFSQNLNGSPASNLSSIPQKPWERSSTSPPPSNTGAIVPHTSSTKPWDRSGSESSGWDRSLVSRPPMPMTSYGPSTNNNRWGGSSYSSYQDPYYSGGGGVGGYSSGYGYPSYGSSYGGMGGGAYGNMPLPLPPGPPQAFGPLGRVADGTTGFLHGAQYTLHSFGRFYQMMEENVYAINNFFSALMRLMYRFTSMQHEFVSVLTVVRTFFATLAFLRMFGMRLQKVFSFLLGIGFVRWLWRICRLGSMFSAAAGADIGNPSQMTLKSASFEDVAKSVGF
mmetsp:Transcript_32510/g.52667  ORF Transcript_32510/g.52667 Transcript_32510/m.52667 type:complete len:339 (-) Transcript_32510:462-1478(-)